MTRSDEQSLREPARASSRMSARGCGAWGDRFCEPTIASLLGEMSASQRKVVEHARTQLRVGMSVREFLQWKGPWGWTLVYRTPESNGVAMAYLVPDPQRPKVCVPTREESLAEGNGQRLPKVVREALGSAPVVDRVRWVSWAIESKEQVEGICGFVRQYGVG